MLHLRCVVGLLICFSEMYKDLVNYFKGAQKNCQRLYGVFSAGP